MDYLLLKQMKDYLNTDTNYNKYSQENKFIILIIYIAIKKSYYNYIYFYCITNINT